jgi:tetratricopeptide (TPR) repeat protein/anti-sigma regulatory factor (Ser/Thr protein kinase)
MAIRKIKSVLLLLFCIHAITISSAQDNHSVSAMNSLPSSYHSLKSDADRMQFLMKALGDSLDEAQLTHVLEWAKLGLQMAEKNNIDSLKGIFLYDIGKAFTYYYNKYDSAIFYYKQVLPYFPDQLRKYHVFSLREIMDRYADLGNKDSSFAYMDRLKSLIDTMPDSSPKKIGLSQNIAVVYQGFGMYRTAIRYFQVAINGNRQNNNSRGLGIALANLGELYNQMEEYEKAILTSKEALFNLKDVNMPYMQTAANIADYYITLRQYDSALLYLNISDEVVEKINDSETRMGNKSVMARIYIAKKKYTAAKNMLDEAIASLAKTDNNWTLCRVLLSYSDLDTSLKKYDEATLHLKQVINISTKNEFLPFTVQALQKLALVCSKSGNYKSAFEYQLEYTRLKDSLATSKSKAELNDLEISYKMVQKEQEIELLQKDNSIKNLQLADNRRSKLLYIAGLVMAILLIGVFYYQRSQRNKIRFEKIKAELETKVLRLQMNPHFVFNSLNSIENFIMQNEKRLASDYLNKFARLVRMILDSSRDEAVPVSKDMEALQLYIDLEQLRFNNKFSYKTYIDPALTTGDYKVPSLLIQPYVENAIVHGLAHSEDENLNLTVTATLEDEKIKYVVQDNGIGREKAREYNRKNKPYHKSIGLQITEARINIFNKQEEKGGSVLFTDLFDENRRPGGTKVEITIKAA